MNLIVVSNLTCNEGLYFRHITMSAKTELGFDILMKTSEIKARYKLLVKKYHPDSTGGNKMLEERFKQINEAYELIMRRLKDN